MGRPDCHVYRVLCYCV